jgi:hypothetical protein
MSEKLFSGIGIYFLNQNESNQQISSEVLSDLGDNLSDKNSFSSKKNSIGFCIAPKFNSSNFKASFSPSVFYEFSSDKQKHFLGSSYSYQSTYSDNNPTGEKSKYTINFFQSNFTAKGSKVGLGAMFNSSIFYVCLKSYFENENAVETLQINEYSFMNNSLNNNKLTIKPNLKRMNHSVHISYNLNFDKHKNYSLTSTFGIGYNHYLNLGNKSPNNDTTTIYYYPSFLSKNNQELDYLHYSFVGRYKHFFAGYTFTKQNIFKYNGLILGYQNDKIKISTCLNLRFGEVGVSNVLR